MIRVGAIVEIAGGSIDERAAQRKCVSKFGRGIDGRRI